MTGHRLLLMRHAKAQWPKPGANDFDRPLTAEGRLEARETGAMMATAGYLPDAVLCSGARRCRETLDALSEQVELPAPEYLDSLYRADPAGYLETIRLHATGGTLLVVGHNPMTEELAMALTADAGGGIQSALAGGFPTCGLAVIRLSTAFDRLAPATGILEAFLTPGMAAAHSTLFPYR
jgi:phosphohistidine phosphatase